jgi:hypothetical protein
MTTKVILFPQQDSGQVAIMAPTGALNPMATAIKDVPAGVPFIIVDATDIPQGVPQEALVVDFREPDGFGTAGGTNGVN